VLRYLARNSQYPSRATHGRSKSPLDLGRFTTLREKMLSDEKPLPSNLKKREKRGLPKTAKLAFRSLGRKILFKMPTHRQGMEGAFLVTPSSPFILSDYYLSEEVTKLRLQYLNPKSLPIGPRTVFIPNSIIFCQVDQLEEFAEKFLSKIDVPITLITGKWSLPGLSDTPVAREILKNPWVVRWYSQNQIFDHLEIEPFPYGVNFLSAHKVFREQRRAKQDTSRIDLLVPFARVHSHLPTLAKQMRRRLQPLMEKKLPIRRYLASLRAAKYVISPPGDRPDTYRHWECIALGTIPVSQLPRSFAELFQGTAILTDDLLGFSIPSIPGSHVRPNPRVAELSFWKDRLGEP